MTHYIFEKLTYRAEKKVPCAGCGKTIRRQQTFWSTLSPWNVNADGEPATRSEAMQKLRNKAAWWQAEPEMHKLCVLVQATDGAET